MISYSINTRYSESKKKLDGNKNMLYLKIIESLYNE